LGIGSHSSYIIQAKLASVTLSCKSRRFKTANIKVLSADSKQMLSGVGRHVKVGEIIIVALWNRADHYIFALWFLLLSFFFSSPNLSRRRLDVCYISTHGVALVRI